MRSGLGEICQGPLTKVLQDSEQFYLTAKLPLTNDGWQPVLEGPLTTMIAKFILGLCQLVITPTWAKTEKVTLA